MKNMSKYKGKTFAAFRKDQIVKTQYYSSIEEVKSSIREDNLCVGEPIYIVEVKDILALKAVRLESIFQKK